MDAINTPSKHLAVGIFSLGLAFIFNFYLEIRWSTSFARVSFILLFLVLIIGPVMRLYKPTKESTPLMTPWKWRGELGIWFMLTALIHFIFVLTKRPLSDLIAMGGDGYGLSNFIGLIALFWAIILAATSCSKAIGYLGVESWKWLHSLAYVIFYLVAGHFAYFQFFSSRGGGPDWFGYMALTMSIIIIVTQMVAFILAIKKHQEEMIPVKKKSKK